MVSSIWFSDESIFTLKGHINKQNNRFWNPKGDNPYASVEIAQFPQKVHDDLGRIFQERYNCGSDKEKHNYCRNVSSSPDRTFPAKTSWNMELYNDDWFQQDGMRPLTPQILY